jgi:hypothetical protein
VRFFRKNGNLRSSLVASSSLSGVCCADSRDRPSKRFAWIRCSACRKCGRRAQALSAPPRLAIVASVRRTGRLNPKNIIQMCADYDVSESQGYFKGISHTATSSIIIIISARSGKCHGLTTTNAYNWRGTYSSVKFKCR